MVKEVHGAGGYGMLVGPAASKAEIERFRQLLIAKPDGYIAQPTLALSNCPTFVEEGIAPRHLDLRPFVLSSGECVNMVPGGLTRVALTNGFAGRQFVAGRRHQGHLGSGGLIMLSRTADHLFWMSRYIERAENLARLLDVTWQMSLVPQSLEAANQNWNAIIALNSLEEEFATRYSAVNAENVLRFMVGDCRQPRYRSSVACAWRARTPMPCGVR